MFNISSCTSQDSTTIISSTVSQPSLPSSSSSSWSSTLVSGSRAIDKHNPIITDGKRSEVSSTKPAGPPDSNHLLLHKAKKHLKNKTNNTKKNTLANENQDDDHIKKVGRKTFSKPSDIIRKVAACNTSKAGVDYITPQESSSRYLLDDTSFLDGFSDSNKSSISNVEGSKFDASSKDSEPAKHSSSSSASSDKVVVLRVSLHCRGCEKKLNKHLSRMPGVTSFNTDFLAKKVTVVGDVTPLQVISSISKVKTAKVWSTTLPSSTHISTSMEQKK